MVFISGWLSSLRDLLLGRQFRPKRMEAQVAPIISRAQRWTRLESEESRSGLKTAVACEAILKMMDSDYTRLELTRHAIGRSLRMAPEIDGVLRDFQSRSENKIVHSVFSDMRESLAAEISAREACLARISEVLKDFPYDVDVAP